MDKLLVRAAIYHEVTYLAGGILAFDNLYFQTVLARRDLFFKHVHPWDVKSLAPLRPGVQRFPGTLVRTVPERTGVGACDAEDADSRTLEVQPERGTAIVGDQHRYVDESIPGTGIVAGGGSPVFFYMEPFQLPCLTDIYEPAVGIGELIEHGG